MVKLYYYKEEAAAEVFSKYNKYRKMAVLVQDGYGNEYGNDHSPYDAYLEEKKNVYKSKTKSSETLVVMKIKTYPEMEEQDARRYLINGIQWLQRRYGIHNVLQAYLIWEQEILVGSVLILPMKNKRIMARTIFNVIEMQSVVNHFKKSMKNEFGYGWMVEYSDVLSEGDNHSAMEEQQVQQIQQLIEENQRQKKELLEYYNDSLKKIREKMQAEMQEYKNSLERKYLMYTEESENGDGKDNEEVEWEMERMIQFMKKDLRKMKLKSGEIVQISTYDRYLMVTERNEDE